ncbi:MAG: alpha amylase catalytic region [Puniceicoccaceae bacterium 5H]|nr:MAG: alpha amylase catalytic region [Puniceicoccaceae bacterium 5H]
MKFTSLLLAATLSSFGATVSAALTHLEPANWWVGMEYPRLQILVHAPDIGETRPELDYPGVTLEEVVHVENPNYLFLYLEIAPHTEAGSFPIEFHRDGQVVERYDYALQARDSGSAERESFGPSDAIYLLMPDRFANGDPSNDSVAGMREQGVDRDEPYARHGGDLRGIINHLTYIEQMGFTALWINPVLENDQSNQSYHGYAITDFYRVDPRMGTLADYRELADTASDRDLKLIMDVILNHIGSEHWWMHDLPMRSWINDYPDYEITNHRRTTNQDPHAAPSDTERMVEGWFVPSMPDLNTRNPLLADYLIQNSIWWIETLGLSGLRIDTYPYPGKTFAAEWCQRVLQEYPSLNLVGEEWSYNPLVIAYWQRGKDNADGYEGHLPSLFDFPTQQAVLDALNHEESMNTGLVELYEALANDFVYADAHNLSVFLGNHDTSRYFVELGEDVGLAKNAVAWLATTRGIPQFYSGDEILMTHPEDGGHGLIRKDFPGGWEGDTTNAFAAEKMTEEAREFQEYVKILFNWRQAQTAVHHGRLTHYAPEHGTYVYFRHDDEQTVMVVLNKNPTPYDLDLSRFDAFLRGHTRARDVVGDTEIELGDTLTLQPKTPLILELW